MRVSTGWPRSPSTCSRVGPMTDRGRAGCCAGNRSRLNPSWQSGEGRELVFDRKRITGLLQPALCCSTIVEPVSPRARPGTTTRGRREGIERGLDRSPQTESGPVPKEPRFMRRLPMGLMVLSAAGTLGAAALAETKVKIENVHLCCPACVKSVGTALKGVDGVKGACD